MTVFLWMSETNTIEIAEGLKRDHTNDAGRSGLYAPSPSFRTLAVKAKQMAHVLLLVLKSRNDTVSVLFCFVSLYIYRFLSSAGTEPAQEPYCQYTVMGYGVKNLIQGHYAGTDVAEGHDRRKHQGRCFCSCFWNNANVFQCNQKRGAGSVAQVLATQA